MVFKKLVSKARKTIQKHAAKLRRARMKPENAPNRFLRFYYTHRNDLLKERRDTYYEKVKAGECVRCTRRAVKGIRFCRYHRKMQEKYNKIARSKKLKKERKNKR